MILCRTLARHVLPTILLGVVIAIVLFLFNPEHCSLYPRCTFHTLVGLKCNGCGLLRAMHHLLHGDLPMATRSNPLVFVVAPLFAMVMAYPALARSRWMLCLLALFSIAFFIARNMDAFLYPR